MSKPISLLLLSIGILFLNTNVFSQQPTNLDPTQSYVTVNMPRAPESAGFEKYGSTQVNEFTGTSNISIPIYTLKSRYLEAPITLAYQANGIKVNQEASWVGLGWDLNVGGRITRETRGAPDFQDYVFCSGTVLAAGMKKIFTHFGGSRENAVLSPATITTFDDNPTDTGIFAWSPILYMTQYAVGEPDIFRANFMGHSLTFYFDKTSVTQTTPDINPTIKFIGEQTTFQVSYTLTSHNVSAFTIKDNDGVTYYFNLVESTTNSQQLGSNPFPGVSPTSWLLTKVTHPSGDNIQFTYANYGSSVPAFTLSSQINWQYPNGVAIPVNPDLNQNVAIQAPYYLTQMASSDVTVNFTLGTRTDLYGPGSRQLNSIAVVDNLTGLTKKAIAFNYSYITATPDAGSQAYLTTGGTVQCYLASPLSQTAYIQTSNSRLRLDSVNVNNGTFEPPYRFTYNPLTVDKYTMSQDHWGYFNQAGNSAYGASFSHLIPNTSLGVATVQNPQFMTAIGGSGTLGSSRECNPAVVQAMILTKVVYPTGGSTQFTYEPHQSTMFPTVAITGGGVRVKTVQNYAQGNLINTKTYSYSGGKYMGKIEYYADANILSQLYGGTDGGPCFKLTSNGAVNFNDMLIGYAQVTVAETGSDGSSNGSVVKTFNVNTSTSSYAYGLGFDVIAPYLTPSEVSQCNLGAGLPVYPATGAWSSWLDPGNKELPPTPSMEMEGKLMQEQYFDNSNNLLKSTSYYYHLANYTNNFYDIRAIQNRAGAFGTRPNGSTAYMNDGIGTCGDRPVTLYISPAKSYHTLTDSVVETDILNGIPHISRKYFTYDNYYQVKSQQVFNSDGTSTTTAFTHVTDYLANYGMYTSNSSLIQAMYGANIITPVFTSTTTRNGAPVNYVNSYYSSPSAGVYVPQYTQLQIGSNATETREQYNQYDAYGHLMERQKPNGVKEDYLWGYDHQFPVASVVGSDITTVSGLVSATVLNAPASDGALRTELNKLRTSLPGALVNTYTYDNVYGITSKTDPSGRTSYFNYDLIGRLSYVQDQDLNVIQRYSYNYAGQPDGANLLVTTMVSATLTGSIPWNATLTNTVTGQSSSYVIYPNSVPTFLANVAMDPYNISLSPEYPQSTVMQLVVNGTTYTGTSFSLSGINISGPTTLALSTAPVACAITMASGYNSPSNGITDNGSTVSFYMAFYTNATLNPGLAYFVGTISGTCVPTATRTMTTSSLGRNWTVTVYTSGQVYWQMTSGTALSPNSTVGGATLTYNH